MTSHSDDPAHDAPGDASDPAPGKADAGAAAADVASEDAAADDADTAPAPRRRRTGVWIGAALLIALVAGAIAALLLLPRLAERVPAVARLLPASEDSQAIDNLMMDISGLDNTVAALSRRLESQARQIATLGDESSAHGATLQELEERLAALEGRSPVAAAPFNGSGGDGGNLAARLEMLTQRVSQLESAMVPLAERSDRMAETLRRQESFATAEERLAATVADLDSRLDVIEQTSSGDRRGTLIALSFAALREMANRGRPFPAEYEALHDILTDSERGELVARLRAIAPFAASGAPTQASLRAGFAEISGRIIRAAHLPEDPAWWQRALATIRGAVVLRPTGEVKGDGVEAVVARAERRLAANDLAAAVRELGTLPPSAAAIAESWLHGARNRLRLDEAMAQFANALLRGAAADLDNARTWPEPAPNGEGN